MSSKLKVFKWQEKGNTKKKYGYVTAHSLALARIEVASTNNLTSLTLKKLSIKPQELVTLNDRQIANFFYKLYELTRSGINILESIQQISLQSCPKIRYTCVKTQALLSKGHSLSSALLSINPLLPKNITSMLKAGEATGNTEKSFLQISKLFQRKYELKRKIIKSLSYPIFVLAIAAIIILIMLILVIPQFGEIFSDYGIELPLITRALLAASQSLRSYGIALLIIPALTLWLGRTLITFNIKKIMAKYVGYLPLFGRLSKLSNQWLLTTLLGSALSAGVSVINAFTLLSESSHTQKNITKRIINQLKSGHSIATTLEESQLLEETHIQQIALAESTGNIDRAFEQLSIKLNQELTDLTAKLNEFIEPIFISLLGLILGMIIIALYIPLFKLGDVF